MRSPVQSKSRPFSNAHCYRPSEARIVPSLPAALSSASVCCIFCILYFGSNSPICYSVSIFTQSSPSMLLYSSKLPSKLVPSHFPHPHSSFSAPPHTLLPPFPPFRTPNNSWNIPYSIVSTPGRSAAPPLPTSISPAPYPVLYP